jgi:hypothetical protein
MDLSCEIPNPKIQAPKKLQIPNFKRGIARVFGLWKLGFVWDLELGAWDFSL